MNQGCQLKYQEKYFRYCNFELKYQIYIPPEGQKRKNLPLLILANDSRYARIPIPEFAVRENPIILFLEFDAEELKLSGWKWNPYIFRNDPVPRVSALLKLIDSVLQEFPVDFERIYLFGTGTGGFVCWELIRRRIGLFAAAVLTGCATDLDGFKPNAATAIRLYHGVDDPLIPVNAVRQLYLRLMDVHCDVKLKEIPGSDLDALLYVSDNAEPLEWLFRFRQKIFTSMPLPDQIGIITLESEHFTAQIAPEAAGNIFSLRHKTSGTPLLREPHRVEELFHTPERFGIPPLFPPNRIEDGAFLFEGKICRLPINQKIQNLHLHGIAVSKPWHVVDQGIDFAELKFVFDENSPEFEGFPFACEIQRRYELKEYGLLDLVTVRNTGTGNLPLGLGFHTAFPAENVRVRVGAGAYEFEIDSSSFLPTGRCLEWGAFDPRESFDPFKKNVSFHTAAGNLSCSDGTVFHGAELVYPAGTLRYVTDEKFGFWYTWNAGGLNDFLCLEPVSWMANALNLPLPASRSGVRKLAAGEEMIFESKIEFEKI